LNPIKILVADDEREFLEALGKILALRGIMMEKAYNGREALDILGRDQFDVIVLDWRMPVMDGLTALKEIRKSDQITPVLILSGYADLALVTEALKGGAADYLSKPCAVESLVAAIETASERNALAREFEAKSKR